MIARLAKRLETVSLAVPMALLLGVALAFALFAMPGWWLGRAVSASGLPALIHAAAPPLGAKPRLLIACAGGLAGALPVWVLFSWLERPVHGVGGAVARDGEDAEAAETAETREPVAAMGDTPVADSAMTAAPVAPAPLEDADVDPEPVVDAVPSDAGIALAASAGEPDAATIGVAAGTVPHDDPAQAKPWLRWLPTAIFARRAETPTEGAPTLRRADAHPDAPARRPIFASADLGAPLDAGGAAWSADPWPAQGASPAEPLLLDAAWQARGTDAAPSPRATIRSADAGEQASAAALMARLEAALAAKPGRPASPPAAGEALREAMAELRRTQLG